MTAMTAWARVSDGNRSVLTHFALLLVCFLPLLAPWPLFSDPSLQRIDDLMQRKQCASALELIRAGDAELKSAEFVKRLLDLSLNCSVQMTEGEDRFGFLDVEPGQSLDVLRKQSGLPNVVFHAWPVHETLQRHAGSADMALEVLAADYYGLVCSSDKVWPNLDRASACQAADRLYSKHLLQNKNAVSCLRYTSFLGSTQQKEYAAKEEAQLQQCLKQYPRDADLILYDALLQYRNKRHAEAIRRALHAAELKTNRQEAAAAWAFAGGVAFESEKYPAAAEYYKKAMEADPTNPQYIEGLITALLFAGKEVEARNAFRGAVQKYPAMPPLSIDIVRHAFSDLDKHEAFLAAAKTLGEDANLDVVKRVMVYRSMALAQLDLGRRAEARLSVDKGIVLAKGIKDERRQAMLDELERIRVQTGR